MPNKFTYSLEVFCLDKWTSLFPGNMQYLQGYLDAKKGYSPRLAHRIIRSDAKVVEEFKAKDEVSIGMVAGWPTAEQYRRAAAKAIEHAEYIEQTEEKRKAKHDSRSN